MIIFPLWGLAVGLLGLMISIIFLWFYLSGAFRSQPAYRLTGLPSHTSHFLATVASMSDSLITNGHMLHCWSDIERIQTQRLQLIRSAQSWVQFETFKMSPGKRATDFAEALREKAIAGVTVQVLADSYGAKELPDDYWRSLTQAGVEVRFFNPFSWRSPLDYVRRNHRKLLIVDHTTAMIGGAGISDLWDGTDNQPEPIPWYDIEVQWQGPIVGFLKGFFQQHWLSAGGPVNLNDFKDRDFEPSAPSSSQAPPSSPLLITPGEEPTSGDSPIRSLFQLCILAARERLWMASPYLLPDQQTCTMLKAIRQQGVDVRILTMGPKSDKPYVYHTSRARYEPLLHNDIRIHEYQPSMMHGKVILVDSQWVSLGSANLDPRSFFHNDELNICTNMPQLIDSIEDFFKAGFEASTLVDVDSWQSRPLHQKIMGSIGNLFYWQL